MTVAGPVIENRWPERKRRKCKERHRSRDGTPAAPVRTEVSDRQRKRLNLNGRQQRIPARETRQPSSPRPSIATARSSRSWKSSRRSTGTTSASTPRRDPELKELLAHNRDEEKEHAAMMLEWLRRHDAEAG